MKTSPAVLISLSHTCFYRLGQQLPIRDLRDVRNYVMLKYNMALIRMSYSVTSKKNHKKTNTVRVANIQN